MSRLYDMKTKRTTGLKGLAPELIKLERKTSRTVLSKVATVLRRRMVQKLSTRGGPSAPGDPPARDEGHLRSVIGKDRPRRKDEIFTVAVGVGEGKAAARKVAELKAEGVEIFAIAVVHEHGGFFNGRRYPARSFARSAEEEVVAEIDSVLRQAFR